MATKKEKYDELAGKYNITARAYFKILQLAIYHETRDNIVTAYETAQYKMTPKIWAKACDILEALYKDDN